MCISFISSCIILSKNGEGWAGRGRIKVTRGQKEVRRVKGWEKKRSEWSECNHHIVITGICHLTWRQISGDSDLVTSIWRTFREFKRVCFEEEKRKRRCNEKITWEDNGECFDLRGSCISCISCFQDRSRLACSQKRRMSWCEIWVSKVDV